MESVIKESNVPVSLLIVFVALKPQTHDLILGAQLPHVQRFKSLEGRFHEAIQGDVICMSDYPQQ